MAGSKRGCQSHDHVLGRRLRNLSLGSPILERIAISTVHVLLHIRTDVRTWNDLLEGTEYVVEEACALLCPSDRRSVTYLRLQLIESSNGLGTVVCKGLESIEILVCS